MRPQQYGLIGVVVGAIMTFSLMSLRPRPLYQHKELRWNDGSLDRRGSCFCGDDDYCMCTPNLSVDIVIELNDGSGICLVQRADNAKLGAHVL